MGLFALSGPHEHSWPESLQVEQVGPIPSHFDFLLLQWLHARRA
jgi:hypothetical protein